MSFTTLSGRLPCAPRLNLSCGMLSSSDEAEFAAFVPYWYTASARNLIGLKFYSAFCLSEGWYVAFEYTCFIDVML